METRADSLIEESGAAKIENATNIDLKDLQSRARRDLDPDRKYQYLIDLLKDCLSMAPQDLADFKQSVLERWGENSEDGDTRERLRLQLEVIHQAEVFKTWLSDIENKLTKELNRENLSKAITGLGLMGEYLDNDTHNWPEYRTALLFVQSVITKFLSEKEQIAAGQLKAGEWDQNAMDKFFECLRDYVIIAEDTKCYLNLDLSHERWLEAWDKLFEPTGPATPEKQRQELLNLLEGSKEDKTAHKHDAELLRSLEEELEQSGISEHWLGGESKLKKMGEFVWEQLKITGRSFLGLRPKAIIKNIIDHPEVYGAAALGFVVKSAVRGALGKGLAAGAAAGGLFGAGIGLLTEVRQKRRRRSQFEQLELGLYQEKYENNFESLWKRPAAEVIAILLTLENKLREKRDYFNKLGDVLSVTLLEERIAYLERQKKLIASRQELNKEKGVDRLFKYIELSKTLENLDPSKRELLEQLELGKQLSKFERRAKKDIDIALGKRLDWQTVAASTFRGAAVGFAGAALSEILSRFWQTTAVESEQNTALPVKSNITEETASSPHNLQTNAESAVRSGIAPIEGITVEVESEPEKVGRGEGFWQPVERQLKARLYELSISNQPEDIAELKDKYHLTPEEVKSQTPSFEKQVDNLVAEILRDNHIIDPEKGTELRVSQPGEAVILNEDNSLSFRKGGVYEWSGKDQSLPPTESSNSKLEQPEANIKFEYKPIGVQQVYAQAGDGYEHLSGPLEKAAITWFGTVGAGTALSGRRKGLFESLDKNLAATGLYSKVWLEKIQASWQKLSRTEQIRNLLILLNPKKGRDRGFFGPLSPEELSLFSKHIKKADYEQALHLLDRMVMAKNDQSRNILVLARDLLKKMINNQVK